MVIVRMFRSSISINYFNVNNDEINNVKKADNEYQMENKQIKYCTN